MYCAKYGEEYVVLCTKYGEEYVVLCTPYSSVRYIGRPCLHIVVLNTVCYSTAYCTVPSEYIRSTVHTPSPILPSCQYCTPAPLRSTSY